MKLHSGSPPSHRYPRQFVSVRVSPCPSVCSRSWSVSFRVPSAASPRHFGSRAKSVSVRVPSAASPRHFGSRAKSVSVRVRPCQSMCSREVSA